MKWIHNFKTINIKHNKNRNNIVPDSDEWKKSENITHDTVPLNILSQMKINLTMFTLNFFFFFFLSKLYRLWHNLEGDLKAGHLRAILQVDLGCDLVGACTQQVNCSQVMVSKGFKKIQNCYFKIIKLSVAIKFMVGNSLFCSCRSLKIAIWVNCSCHSFCKEQREWIALIALNKNSDKSESLF